MIKIISLAMIKKGKFNQIYNTDGQKLIFAILILMNQITILIHFIYFQYSLTKNRRFYLSRLANIIIIYSNIIYFCEVYDTFTNDDLQYIVIMYLTVTAGNIFVYSLYQLEQSATYCRLGQTERLIDLVVIILAYGLFIEIDISIMIIFLIKQTIYLAQTQLGPNDKDFFYIHIIVSALHLLVLRLFFNWKQHQLFLASPIAQICIFIYLIIIFELNLCKMPFFVRKFMFFAFMLFQQPISLSRQANTCRICYFSQENGEYMVGCQFRHKYHKQCVRRLKSRLCSFDKTQIK